MDVYLLGKIFSLLPNDLKALSNVCPNFKNIIDNHPLLHYIVRIGLNENLLEYAKEHKMKDLHIYADENIEDVNYIATDGWDNADWNIALDAIWMDNIDDIIKNSFYVTAVGSIVDFEIPARTITFNDPMASTIKIGYIPKRHRPKMRTGINTMSFTANPNIQNARIEINTQTGLMTFRTDAQPPLGEYAFPLFCMIWSRE